MMNSKQKWNESVKSIPVDKSHSNYAVEKEKSFPRNSNILDLGGSIGVDSFYFISKGHRVTLVDISDEALHLAKEKGTKEGVEDSLIITELDLNDAILPFESNSFDVVFSRLALHYFSQATTGKIFKEIERVLKEGGKAYLTLKSPEDSQEMDFLLESAKEIEKNLFDDNGSLKSRYTKEQLIEILKSEGIINCEVNEITEDLSERTDKIKSGNDHFILNEVVIRK